MNLTKPERLKQGDTIGIVAPSMYIHNEQAVDRGLSFLKELGFQVDIGPNVYSKYENTTAPAAKRAEEIMAMFERTDIKVILCLTGGGAASEVLDLLDYDVIHKHPTIFLGQSDITHFHLALTARAKMMTLHGLELIWGFGAEQDNPIFKYNVDLNMKCCCSTKPLGVVPHHTSWKCWRPGKAEGRLVGGLVGIVTNLAMGEYWPPFDKTILFWEAFGGNAGKICKRFAALEADGLFQNITGMVIGKIVDGDGKDDEALKTELRKQILEITKEYELPIIANADFGHNGSFMPLPEGILARIDVAELKLEYLEPMVK